MWDLWFKGEGSKLGVNTVWGVGIYVSKFLVCRFSSFGVSFFW